MKTIRRRRGGVTFLVILGLLLPSTPIYAGQPAEPKGTRNAAQSTRVAIRDVALDRSATLTGILLTQHGSLLAQQTVALSRDGRERARAQTDARGRFAFRNLTGGLYHIRADASESLLRVWTAAAAPPIAESRIVLVSGGPVQRGQRRISELLYCDPVILGVILAAAIAIPIAVTRSRSGS